MGSFEPTPEQRRAMEDRGGSLLVSAAAVSVSFLAQNRVRRRMLSVSTSR